MLRTHLIADDGDPKSRATPTLCGRYLGTVRLFATVSWWKEWIADVTAPNYKKWLAATPVCKPCDKKR